CADRWPHSRCRLRAVGPLRPRRRHHRVSHLAGSRALLRNVSLVSRVSPVAPEPRFDGSCPLVEIPFAVARQANGRSTKTMSIVAVWDVRGATGRAASGVVRGRVGEIAAAPQEHPTRIAYLIVKTGDGERLVTPDALKSAGASVRAATEASQWARYTAS